MKHYCEHKSKVLPQEHFLTRIFKEFGVDFKTKKDVQLLTIYETYNAKSINRIHFEKLDNESWVCNRDGSQEVCEERIENEDEINGMETKELLQGHGTKVMQTEKPFHTEHPDEPFQTSQFERTIPIEETLDIESVFIEEPSLRVVRFTTPQTFYQLSNIGWIYLLKLVLSVLRWRSWS